MPAAGNSHALPRAHGRPAVQRSSVLAVRNIRVCEREAEKEGWQVACLVPLLPELTYTAPAMPYAEQDPGRLLLLT